MQIHAHPDPQFYNVVSSCSGMLSWRRCPEWMTPSSTWPPPTRHKGIQGSATVHILVNLMCTVALSDPLQEQLLPVWKSSSSSQTLSCFTARRQSPCSLWTGVLVLFVNVSFVKTFQTSISAFQTFLNISKSTLFLGFCQKAWTWSAVTVMD